MVFSVKRKLALSIRPTTGYWLTGARSAAQVGNGRHRRKQYLAAQFPDRMAEVHVLRVEKESFVEQPRTLGVGAIDQQAGAADPVHEPLASRRRGDPFPCAAFLPPLAER